MRLEKSYITQIKDQYCIYNIRSILQFKVCLLNLKCRFYLINNANIENIHSHHYRNL